MTTSHEWTVGSGMQGRDFLGVPDKGVSERLSGHRHLDIMLALEAILEVDYGHSHRA